MSTPTAPSIDRQIVRLAVPALGALVAEPLFLLADSAMVGHLGVEPLAGLGIASAVLQTIIGLMVFLAYATTPAAARRWGAGDLRGAVSVGVDGIWLALALGVALTIAGIVFAPGIVALFGGSPGVSEQARTYLAISMLGIPAMLAIFAGTGLLRGLQDTKTPLIVAGAGFGANIALNALLIYGLGWGIAGSAAGTVIAQWAMFAVYAVVVARHARRAGASLRPHVAGIGGSARAGGWLLVRTASLRAAMLLAVATAASLGTAELAGFQVVMTIFATLAFALDALAIAAQALIGKGLGAADVTGVAQVLRRCLQWGTLSGVALGAIVALTSPVIGLLFTGDPALAALIQPSLIITAIATPLAGVVFVLDGVLIGAGDARYLAVTGVINLAVFVPLALLAGAGAGAGAGTGPWGLAALAAAFMFGYLGARGVTLWLRARTDAWMRTGI